MILNHILRMEHPFALWDCRSCSPELEAMKSVSVDSKAGPKVESVSEYITASVCKSEPTSPFVINTVDGSTQEEG